VSLTVVLGGTRSGKSARAEALAAASGLPVRYVATADGTDPLMRERISAHAARRPPEWETVEAGASLCAATGNEGCILVDGLGTWIAGRMHHGMPHDEIVAEVERTAEALAGASCAIVVAEQAGEGVLPADAESRAWLDLLGAATQRLAARAERVELVVAGRALDVCASGSTRWDEMHTRRAEVGLREHGDTLVRPGDADHAVNVVAGGPPAWLRAALEAADVTRYPDETDATHALAALHGRQPDEIVPTNGAAEALWLLGPALRPTLAACVHPGFTEAEAALHAHGIAVTRVHRDPDENFALDPTRVPDAADLVIVGNPASPSGTLDPASAILALRRPGRTVVVDEAFMDLVPGEAATLVRDAPDDVIVIRSLTKVLSIPGLRAGYAVAAPARAALLRAVRPPWSANALALAALTAAATRPAEMAEIAEQTAAQRGDLQQRLEAVGVRVWPGTANFVLIEVDDGRALTEALRAEHIAVRPAASFPGLNGRHVRVTARDAAANARVAEAIGRAL
jgi:histidinol-phosphate/aromatic aminotransferase/cobyric acid decarboxylase-like protein/adenosyl cobinamide kinase/adenosyl cobinamide phosphate guanylyltransferase